jgi:hypothetical protein
MVLAPFDMKPLKLAFGVNDPALPDAVMVSPCVAALFARVTNKMIEELNPKPDEQPSLDKPCPAPHRKGRHEVYTGMREGAKYYYCKACGANERE